VIAGDATSLYLLSPGSPNFAEINYGYAVPAGEFWNFTLFGQVVIAVSESINPQAFTLDTAPIVVTNEVLGTGNGVLTTFSGTLAHHSNYVQPGTIAVTAGSVSGTDNSQGAITGTGITSGTINYKTGAWSITFAAFVPNATNITANYKYGGGFADLTGSPPQARYCAVVKDFLMLANTFDATNGAQPQRIQWSAINDPTTWPAAGSVQEAQVLAGSQVIPGDQGWIQGVVGNLGTSDCAIIFERAVWRGVFMGSPDVFAFYPCEGVRGSPSPKSIVQMGSFVFYLGEDGFYKFDGSNSYPIGLNRVDKTFFNNINPNYMYNVIAAVDPVNKLVMWSYPSVNSSNGEPDTMLVYNWGLDKWGNASLAVEYIFRSISQGYSLEGLDNVSPPNDLDTLPYSLDAREWTGGTITIAAFSQTHTLGFFTGAPLAATIDTVEVEPFSEDDPGRMAWVDSSMPLIDGGQPTVSIGSRNSVTDPTTGSAKAPSFTTAVSVSKYDGRYPHRVEGRFIRGRIQTTAGAAWNHFKGLSVSTRPGAAR
jgi:hypothetical protein